MIRTFVLVCAALSAVASSAYAQGAPPPFMDMRGTPEDQRDCRPDAIRLCRHVLDRNDSMVVLQCFLQNQDKLSTPCRRVLQKYGQLPR
jgi:hypothetical protein